MMSWSSPGHPPLSYSGTGVCFSPHTRPPPPWAYGRFQSFRHLTITLPLGPLSTATIIYMHFIITAPTAVLTVGIFCQALCSETQGGMKACKCDSCLACPCTEASRPSSICSFPTLQLDEREKKNIKITRLRPHISSFLYLFFMRVHPLFTCKLFLPGWGFSENPTLLFECKQETGGGGLSLLFDIIFFCEMFVCVTLSLRQQQINGEQKQCWSKIF